MPYIDPADRKRLDEAIVHLSNVIVKIEEEHGDSKFFAGPLNYCITKLTLEVLPERRYWAYALADGVLSTCRQEFYRRYIAPYEDEALATNGDVQVEHGAPIH